jgi:hypothetical protein
MALFENSSEPEWKSCTAMINGTILELSWIETIPNPDSSSTHAGDLVEIGQLDIQPKVHQNLLEKSYRQVEQQIRIFELRRDQV